MLKREFTELDPLEKTMACLAIAGAPFSFSFILKMAGLDESLSTDDIEAIVAELTGFGLEKQFGYLAEEPCYVFNPEVKVKVLNALNVDVISVFDSAEGHMMNRHRRRGNPHFESQESWTSIA